MYFVLTPEGKKKRWKEEEGGSKEKGIIETEKRQREGERERVEKILF